MERREDVLENLRFADDEIHQSMPGCKEVELTVIGGACMLIRNYISRYTVDIDTVTKLEDAVKECLWAYSINNDSIEVATLHPSYMFRLKKLNETFKVLKVYLISDEDLVISKVGAYRVKDKSDLTESGILDRINTQLLIELGEDVAKHNESFRNNWLDFRRNLLFS
jgi:hypothetical protein